MACFRLRSYDQSPPGGFPYVDPSGKTFASQPLIEAQAQIVASWRAANNKPRAGVRDALVDIDHYTCARMSNNTGFCVPCDPSGAVALNVSSPIIAPPCSGCGAPV